MPALLAHSIHYAHNGVRRDTSHYHPALDASSRSVRQGRLVPVCDSNKRLVITYRDADAEVVGAGGTQQSRSGCWWSLLYCGSDLVSAARKLRYL